MRVASSSIVSLLRRRVLVIATLGLLPLLLTLPACTSSTGLGAARGSATPTPLRVYTWAGDLLPEFFAEFTAATGLPAEYVTFASTEEAVAAIRAGETYDVVNIDNRYIAALIAEGRLAEINTRHLANFKNIALNFRGLTFDPANRYSIPNTWGTTGIVQRPDRLDAPVTSWRQVLDLAKTGRVAVWRGLPRDTIGLTLHALGYSANTSDPAELEAARVALLAVAPHLRFVESWDDFTVGPAMRDGPIAASQGYSYEVLYALDQGIPLTYTLPSDGPLLWGDNWVIPITAHNPAGAEQFIDFMLRPDIAARAMQTTYLQAANDAAYDFLPPELRNNPLLFPSDEQLRTGEIILGLDPATQARYDAIWEEVLAAVPPD